jgi:stage II sporulation protein R
LLIIKSMRKPLALFLILASIVTLAIFLVPAFRGQESPPPPSYIRIHIRANSDSEDDQRVKLLVRDELVKMLIPRLAECADVNAAKEAIASSLKDIERVANLTLSRGGKTYESKALLLRENFPLREYDGLTLPSGEYDALIVNLGEGEGANWWCVAFPPLCFVPDGNGGQAKYKSKILEIIGGFR